VLEEAARREIKRGTLQRAKDALGVKVEKQTGVEHGAWMWSLPADEPEAEQPEPKRQAQSESNILPFQKPSSSE
jgi:hypothetical protein